MSRPDLFDLALTNGGPRLIPDDLCTERRIGRAQVALVLFHRLMHADAVGVVAWGTPRIAEDLDMARRKVQDCDAILEAAGLMERIGKRRRAIAYRMLPKLLDAIAQAHEDATDDDDEVAGIRATSDRELTRKLTRKLTREVTREVPRTRVTKGSEEKKSNHRPLETVRVPAPRTPTDDMSDEDQEAIKFLDRLSTLTGHYFNSTGRAKAAASRAIRGRWDPPGAVQAWEAEGHDLIAAGPGLILTLLERLPQRIHESWRDSLPKECPHGEHPDYPRDVYPNGTPPNLCASCRAEAGGLHTPRDGRAEGCYPASEVPATIRGAAKGLVLVGEPG